MADETLIPMHERAGARFLTIGEARVPAAFADLATELAVLRGAAGLLDLGHHAVVRIGGRRAQKFLHAMLTQDVNTMKPGVGRFAAFLNDTGKTVGVMLLLAVPDGYLALIPPGSRESVVDALRRFVLAQDVRFDEQPGLGLLSLQGPRANEVLESIAGEPLGLEVPFAFRQMALDGIEVTVVEHGRVGERGFDLVAPVGSLERLFGVLVAGGATPVGHEALNAARIEAGVPWMGAELDETTIPLEAHLRHAISYKKGCYIGQEVIAMMTYRGQAPRLLRGLRVRGEVVPEAGTPVTRDGKKAGVITSAALSPPQGGPIALALLKNKLSEPGGTVRIEPLGLDAEVVELPFYAGTALVPRAVDE
jgi:folate-binding protein YgfZ